MRSALGKELRKQFTQAISRAFPGFVEVKAPSVWLGARMYAHRTPQGSYFIRLVPTHNSDDFRVMFGWSSSGEFPCESRPVPRPELFDGNFPSHDGFEFRITQVINKAGATSDRKWVLDDPMGVAFGRTLQEFAKPGDSEVDTLERATSQGLSYLMSSYRETAVEKLLPKIPALVEDCVVCIRQTAIPYFETIREWRARNAT